MKYEWIDEYLLKKPGVSKDLQRDWNSVKADGDVPDEILMDLLDQAYQIVLGSLSKKKQKEILSGQ